MIGYVLTLNSLGGDAPNSWKTPYVLVLLILGILAIIAFVLWENKFQYAMVPMNIWRDRDFSLVSILDTFLKRRRRFDSQSSSFRSCFSASLPSQ